MTPTLYLGHVWHVIAGGPEHVVLWWVSKYIVTDSSPIWCAGLETLSLWGSRPLAQ